MLDLVIFTAQLSSSLGPFGTVMLFANYGLTAYILRTITPAFGKLAAIQARLEGEYRAGVGRVGREAEEIAFYQVSFPSSSSLASSPSLFPHAHSCLSFLLPKKKGGLREKEIIWNAYLKLIKHVNSIIKIRVTYSALEDFIIKYMWSAAGYTLMSIPSELLVVFVRVCSTFRRRRSSSSTVYLCSLQSSSTRRSPSPSERLSLDTRRITKSRREPKVSESISISPTLPCFSLSPPYLSLSISKH